MNQIEVTALIVGVVVAALCLVLGRYVWPAGRAEDRDALLKSQAEVARLNRESAALRDGKNQLDEERRSATEQAKAAGEEVARLMERTAGLTKQNEEQTGRSRALEAQLAESANEAKAAATEVARLRERETGLTGTIQSQAAQLAELHTKLTVEFENIANRILKANIAEASETSHKTLTTLLDPLRERIQEFQKRVESTYEAESREVLSLKEQIKLIVETSHTVGNQADGLARALRGDSQLLGRWGELALERILEAAGLTEGREYISQGRGLQLRSDDGAVQKPDIVVMLPEQRTIIIDSKIPLASYERLIEAKDEAERARCAERFVHDMKGHIESLSEKRYQDNEKLDAHDCALMFVPVEGALAAALREDPELFVYAWDRRVVLVGPPTLLMTMRTVASIWRYQLQSQNAQEIAGLAGDLCDKISASLIDLNDVTDKISGALNAQNQAVRRLSTGRGNALSIGERIRSLGVRVKRSMPSMLVDGLLVAGDAGGPETQLASDCEHVAGDRDKEHAGSA